jgi:hypothetical protein
LDAFNVLNRELELEEVQMFCQSDDGLRCCAIDGIEFQPVKYAPYLSQEAEGLLREGKKLTEIGDALYYGGSFFQNEKISNGAILPVSGSVFNPLIEDGDGKPLYAKGSPMIVSAKRIAKILGKKGYVWGEPLAKIQARLQQRFDGLSEYKRRVDKAEEVFTLERRRDRPHLNNALAKLEINLKPANNGA